MVKIYTASMSTKTELPVLDITVKNKKEDVFAPTWDMVWDWKNRKITKAIYTEMYYKRMRESYVRNRARWNEILNMDVVVFKCYCDSDDFCHRFLLADIFVKLGAVYMGEIRKEKKEESSLLEDLSAEGEVPLVEIYTSKLIIKTQQPSINVSSKGNPVFSPTYDMVVDLRDGKITEEQYINMYCELMQKSSQKHKKEWWDLLHKKEIVLKCYGEITAQHSPRFLLANILTQLGATYIGEIKGDR